MADKISVLLVDDHALVRRGFRRILEDEEDIVVKGEASDGDEAVRLAGHLKPDVIVMDCALPGSSGLVATRKILEHNPKALVLMLSMHSEDTWVRQSLEAGARGYMLKNALDLELVDAIRRVAAGEEVLDPQIAPGVGTTVAGGMSYREAQLCMEMIADTGRIGSLDIMELNPALDVRNKTAVLAVDLVESLFGKSTLLRERFAPVPTARRRPDATSAGRTAALS